MPQRPYHMGLTCLLCLSTLALQGADFLETPEVKRYAQLLAHTKSFDVTSTSTRSSGTIWKRGNEIRMLIGDKLYERSRAGWLLRDLLLGRNRRLEWYDDVPLVELLMLVPIQGEATGSMPRALRMTREVPQDGATVVEVGYRLVDTFVDVRNTVDYWFSPVTGLISEIGWRREGMTQPTANSLNLEWNLNPTDAWPAMEVVKPHSIRDFGRYEILSNARDSEAYARVLLPKGVTAELEASCGETHVMAKSNQLDIKGTPGSSGLVLVAGGYVAVRFFSRTRLIIHWGAIRNAGRRVRIVGMEKIRPGQTVPAMPGEYPEEGRTKPVVVKPDFVTILK